MHSINELSGFKVASIVVIFVITILSGWFPFHKRAKLNDHTSFEIPWGEALAAGVFLGAGLIHMLADASGDFNASGIDYPVPSLLAGVVFLALLWLEHLGKELYHKNSQQSPAFAILAVFMLSIHSFLAGAALGLSGSLASIIIILLAILAHKWAASFALAVHINKSAVGRKSGMLLFLIFACMTPLGIILGDIANRIFAHYTLLPATFTALSAGTFLYLGTLHGLNRATMLKCCNLRYFSLVIIGFAIMAVVAIWT